MYVCGFMFLQSQSASEEIGGVKKGQAKKKTIDLPPFLQCCNHWVCASVSLCLHVPQLQGRHQVVKHVPVTVLAGRRGNKRWINMKELGGSVIV